MSPPPLVPLLGPVSSSPPHPPAPPSAAVTVGVGAPSTTPSSDALALDEEEDDDEATPLWRRVIPRAAALSVAYVSMGTAVYMQLEGWSPVDAAFFALQAALCVGYSGVTLTSSASELFTAAYVLTGNVLASGAIALFVQASLAPAVATEGGKKTAGARKAAVPQDADGGGDATGRDAAADVATGSSRRAPQPPRSECKVDELRGMALLMADAITIVSLLRSLSLPETFEAAVEVLYLGGGRAAPVLLDEDLEALGLIDADGSTAAVDQSPPLVPSDTSAPPPGVADLRRELAAFFSDVAGSAIGRVLSGYTLLWTWIGVGTLFFASHDGLPPARALLASVSSLTTFGLISPHPDDIGHVFVIVFLTSGVAIYANTLGRVADAFRLEWEIEQQRVAARRRRRRRDVAAVSPPRCDVATGAATTACGGLSWAEYLEHRLLQRGVRRGLLAEIREEYEQL